MSREAVQAVIGRGATEGAYRDFLFSNPEEALDTYELTAMELSAIKSIDVETLETFACDLDEHISEALSIES